MYYLTLTKADRDAIDWIGDRYTNGHGLREILEDSQVNVEAYDREQYDWWNECEDLTFAVSEADAWSIADDAATEDSPWPCFGPDLAAKMQAFVDSIV